MSPITKSISCQVILNVWVILVNSFHLFFYSYEFKVKPKNELGEGPLSDPVSFNTESGRVTQYLTVLGYHNILWAVYFKLRACIYIQQTHILLGKQEVVGGVNVA